MNVLLLVLAPCSALVMHPATVPHQYTAMRSPAPIASAKILPVAYGGIGAGLLVRAASAGTPVDAAVLASTGLLSVLNLAVTDNERYAGAKRAVGIYKDRVSLPFAAQEQLLVAKKWYSIVRVHTFGQLAGLTWMLKGVSTIRGAAAFMGANVLFFALGAGAANHDKDGVPAPKKPQLVRFILITDLVLLFGALLGAAAPLGSTTRAFGASLFALGALIGAVEGAPKLIEAVKSALS